LFCTVAVQESDLPVAGRYQSLPSMWYVVLYALEAGNVMRNQRGATDEHLSLVLLSEGE
jgi:hypothetical protein